MRQGCWRLDKALANAEPRRKGPCFNKSAPLFPIDESPISLRRHAKTATATTAPAMTIPSERFSLQAIRAAFSCKIRKMCYKIHILGIECGPLDTGKEK
jgi:hypothetical protein